MLTDIEINKFNKYGYLHLKNIFTKDEVKKYRDEIIIQYDTNLLSQSSKTDLLSQNILDDLLLDSRILNRIKSLIGQNIIYFGDSSWLLYQPNKNNLTGAYHTDNADRYWKGPDWNGNYPLIRFGIYLQDHSKQGGGIIFGGKTHKFFIQRTLLRVIYQEIIGIFNGNFRYIPYEIGDLVIWNLRTVHSGNASRIKFINIPISNRLSKILPQFLQLKCKDIRVLVSGTFGKEGKHLNRYIKYLKTRKYQIEQWLNDKISSKNLKKMTENNIKYLDMKVLIKKEIEDGIIKIDELKSEHIDIN